MFILADGTMHAHISEMQVGTYKKAHRHGADFHVMCVAGKGYSLLWPYHCGNLFPCHSQPRDGTTLSLAVTGVPARATMSIPW